MIKLVVIEQFSLGNNPKYKFDDIKKTIVRKSIEKNEDGVLYVGDTFESDESMAKYLLNEIENPENRPFVEKTEVEPEADEKPVKKTARKRTTKKKEDK